MFYRKESEIELSKKIPNINEYTTTCTSVMLILKVDVVHFTKDILKSACASLDKIITENMKANLIASHKNPEFQKCLENHWNQYEKPEIQREEILRSLSIKSL